MMWVCLLPSLLTGQMSKWGTFTWGYKKGGGGGGNEGENKVRERTELQ